MVAANGKKAEATILRGALAGVDCNAPSPACTTLADTAGSAGNLGNAAFWTLLGSGLAAAGAVTCFVWPTAKDPPSAGAVVHVLPSVGIRDLALSATGTF